MVVDIPTCHTKLYLYNFFLGTISVQILKIVEIYKKVLVSLIESCLYKHHKLNLESGHMTCDLFFSHVFTCKSLFLIISQMHSCASKITKINFGYNLQCVIWRNGTN